MISVLSASLGTVPGFTRKVVAARPDRSSRGSLHLFDNHKNRVPAMTNRMMASSRRRFIVAA